MPDARFAGLTPLFAPRSVAVLGASSDPTRISGRPLAFMKAQGFKGALYPINPNRAEVQGLKAYPSVADLTETPDVAIVAIAAEMRRIDQRSGGRGVSAVMFTAGFVKWTRPARPHAPHGIAVARSTACISAGLSRRFDAAPRTTRRSPRLTAAGGSGRIGIASQSGAWRTFYTLAQTAASAPRCAS